MANVNSYYLYQKFEKRGDQPWIPVFPSTYSVDGDETMPLVVKQLDDPSCNQPIYRWIQTENTICVDASTIESRTISGTPYCNGYDKYVDTTNEQSFDSGETWQFVSSSSTLVEADSEYCGYEPPFNGKYMYTLDDSSTISAECDSSSAITKLDLYPKKIVAAKIGNCVTEINMRVFENSELTSIIIPDSVTKIWDYAFDYCTGLTSVTIGSGVTQLGDYVFNGCVRLPNITIPNSVTKIGRGLGGTFISCSSLTSVTIGSGVTRIYSNAFNNCTGLTSVTIYASTPPTASSDIFYDTPLGGSSGGGAIYVPRESVEAYKVASGWSTYSDKIEPIT
jgi:hypothetical protein